MTCSLRVGDAQKQKPRGGRVSPKPERENLERADADIFLSCGKTVYIYIYIYISISISLYIYIRRNPANLLPGGSPEALEA